MPKPLISVIVPVFNVEKFLGECVDSLLAQTYKNVEILLIDDGSTDGSGKLCDEFKKKDSRIVVFHQENAGLSAARNFGIKKAKGDFLAFADSDDFVEKSFLEELFGTLEKNDADISVCGFDAELPEEETLSGKDATLRLLTKQENLDILAWNKLYKKSLFEENKIFYPEGRIHEDNLTTYKLYSKAKKVSFLSKSLYNYRKREGSITDKNKKEFHLEMRELAAREAIEFFGTDPDLKSAAEISLLLAKFAFLDNALAGRIEEKYIEKTIFWLKVHAKDFENNRFLSPKLKTYLLLVTKIGGKGYKLFRRIKHD